MRLSWTLAVITLAAVAAALTLGIGASAAGSPEMDVVTLVNQERAAVGLAPLGTDVRLFSAAEGHARWMADTDTFSHIGAAGSNAGDRASAAGYDWTVWGEVLAAGQGTAEEAVLGRTCDRWCVTPCQSGRCDGWKQSSAHWSLLMGTEYRDLGVGLAIDDSPGDPYRHWWAATLGNSARPATPVGAGTPAASETPSPTTRATMSGTPTQRATATASPIASATSVGTATVVSTPTTTDTPTAGFTPTTAATPRVPTATRAPATATAVDTPTATHTPTATDTPTAVASPTPAATRAAAAATQATGTATDSATATASATATPAPTRRVATKTRLPATATASSVPTAEIATPTAATTVPQPSSTPAGGSILLGRVHTQVGSVRGGTSIYVDGVPRAVTGANGWFVVIGVASGWRKVEAKRPGALTSTATLLISPGTVASVGDTLLVLGDVYGNGQIDLVDRLLLSAAYGRCVGTRSFQPWLDLDRNGCIGDSDMQLVELNMGRVGPIPWSADGSP